MSRSTRLLCKTLAASVLAAGMASVVGATPAKQALAGIGRSATAAEIRAWDIDVRGDFSGLPPGSGSVAKGEQIWEAKCESCHGVFGESNLVFTPIAGGVSAQDLQTGRTASLKRPDFPQRSTLMKISHLSTLWDYIHRAMPWNAPKSLSDDEVYAVTAYVLHLGDIVPADFTLSDRNIREVQARLPNRNGMSPYAPMWKVDGKPDVHNIRCMQNCPQEMQQMSTLPDYARNQHGDLSAQNRQIGAVRGTDTTRPAGAVALIASATLPPVKGNALSGHELAQKHTCAACHQSVGKLVGPSHAEISAKYAGNAAAEAMLMAKVRAGGSGVWGSNVMPPHAGISDEDLRALVRWSLAGGN